MRLEQRIGRVDRIGQRRPVHVVHLIAHGSGEAQVLSRLQSRVARVRADIGGADPLGMPLDDDGGLEADLITTVWGQPSSGAIRLKPDPTLKPDPARYETAQLWTPSLQSDAQAEAGRIAIARTLAKRGDEQVLARLEGLGPSVSKARRWRTRAELGGRTVMLWQVVAIETSGLVVGSTIVPVLVAKGRRLDDEEVLERVTRAADAWRMRAAIGHDAFIGTRLVRESAEAPKAADLFQPGLFERRGDRAHSAAVDAQDATERHRADRIAAIERALTISFLPPQLLLVLTP
jgi:hypothetical protein